MPASPTTQSAFFEVLARSRLLSPESLAQVERHREAPDAATPNGIPTATDLADRLVTTGVLTRWQADKLLQGKSRGFFLGPYRLLYKVARGGMSTIYAGRHSETGIIRALKVLPLSKADKASYLPRFLREAEIARSLRHPNIVEVYDIHADSDGVNDVHFMAMELLDGRDLAEIVQADGALPCRIAADYVRQAALGLQYAHQAGMVHRDVKPGNLFVSTDGVIRILDLGLAQHFDSEESLTREYNERVLGTADYLAPEQAVDSHSADARADIYSLGCTFYFLLAGWPPFREGSLTQRILAHQTKSPPPLASIRDDVPEVLRSLIDQMMVKVRTRRIQTADEVAVRLAEWLSRSEQFSGPEMTAISGQSITGRAPFGPVTSGQVTSGRAKNLPSQDSDALDQLLFPPDSGLSPVSGLPVAESVGNVPSIDASPTDAIRSSETPAPRKSNSSPRVPDRESDSDTAYLSVPWPSAEARGESATENRAQSPYRTEFESFLRNLDLATGIDSIVKPHVRLQQLRSLAGSMPDPDEPYHDDPENHPAVGTPVRRRRFLITACLLAFVGIGIIAALQLSPNAAAHLNSLFRQLREYIAD